MRDENKLPTNCRTSLEFRVEFAVGLLHVVACGVGVLGDE